MIIKFQEPVMVIGPSGETKHLTFLIQCGMLWMKDLDLILSHGLCVDGMFHVLQIRVTFVAVYYGFT